MHFDNYFRREHVPLRYAAVHGLPLARARAELLTRYRSRKGTLARYCVEHWSRELVLDIALLKREVGHLIAMHPQVVDFLEALTALGKRRVLVTNAHPQSIAFKLEKTPLAGHFERIICAHELGIPKEADDFWPRVQTIEPFDRERTLFIDDSPRVLETARDYGFRWLLAVLAPDSKASVREPGGFPAIRYCADLLPGMGT